MVQRVPWSKKTEHERLEATIIHMEKEQQRLRDSDSNLANGLLHHVYRNNRDLFDIYQTNQNILTILHSIIIAG